jgi:Molecular chaperone (small heat shock protein)
MRYMQECRDEQQYREAVIPRITIMETDSAVVVKAEMAGLQKENINVEAHDGNLTIRGKAKDTAIPDGYVALYQERYSPVYSRTLTLGNQIDPEKISAVYEQGILTLTMPKRKKYCRKKFRCCKDELRACKEARSSCIRSLRLNKREGRL